MNDKVAKEIDTILRLHNVKCPNNCDDGILYNIWIETEPECCGHFCDNGECCGSPFPSGVERVEGEHCNWCYRLYCLKDENEVDNDALQELVKAAK